jgi:AbrB family looped-hinge helix DNA binding protein
VANVLLQIRSNGQITLTASIRRRAKLKEGDALEAVVEKDGSVRLIPKAVIDRSQAYFWTERWQAGEREAQADIEAGRVQGFDDMDEALAFLDGKYRFFFQFEGDDKILRNVDNHDECLKNP